MAQNDSKRALAVKLAQMQQKADGSAMAEQLTASAVQPLLAGWSQRLDETVPPARQKDVRDKLDVELKKYADSTQKVVEAQTAKAAEAALVPIFMEAVRGRAQADRDLHGIARQRQVPGPRPGRHERMGQAHRRCHQIPGRKWRQELRSRCQPHRDEQRRFVASQEISADRVTIRVFGVSPASGPASSLDTRLA